MARAGVSGAAIIAGTRIILPMTLTSYQSNQITPAVIAGSIDAAATEQQLITTSEIATQLIIQNTGSTDLYYGVKGDEPLFIAPGSEQKWPMGPGQVIDLSDVYLLCATAGNTFGAYYF